MQTPRILVSAGEPAGIGPDITIKAIQQNLNADIIVIGDPILFADRAKQLDEKIEIKISSLQDPPEPHKPGILKILPVDLSVKCESGKLNKKNARYVLNVLDIAIDACIKSDAAALVTGPIQKSILAQEIAHFTGHTEYLAEKTQTEKPVMMLATEGLRVALATTHLPLSEVPAQITKANISQVLKILHHDLITQFGITQPKIIVSGLNPHAGEDGLLGNEEINVITPIVNLLKTQGMDIIGPLPADTLFTEKYLKDADAVLVMYHDQGLPVLKYKGFGNAINVTLGLPIVRTSVDHGTALDLAGTGKANAHSMILALNTACEITQ